MKLDNQLTLDCLFTFPERFVVNYYKWKDWPNECLNLYLKPYHPGSEVDWHIQIGYHKGERRCIYVARSDKDQLTKYWCINGKQHHYPISNEDAIFIEEFLKWGHR